MGESVLTAPSPAAALDCDGVPLPAIARAAGTPTYVYSAAAVRAQYHRLDAALHAVPHRIHYSAKANANGAILRLLRSLGAGVDIVSGGELYRAQRAGFAGADIVFSGVGKTPEELRAALEAEVLLLNVESAGELLAIEAIAGALGRAAPVALRVNPEVSVETPHPYTRTGERGMKFGIPYDEALEAGAMALALPHVRLLGLDMHIGSQVTRLEPYVLGLERLVVLLARIRQRGAPDLRYLDAGGGLAVTYGDEQPTDVEAFGRAVAPLVRGTGLELLVEPGRYLVGNAGVLLTRILYRKRSGGREYVIVDAGMNDLLRPSHYNAYHHIEAVQPGAPAALVDVVGPVCETGDFFALERVVGHAEPGELLVIRSAGAYGFAMASNYNSRPRGAEVMVDGGRFAVVTERESHDDLMRREVDVPAWSEP